MTFDPATIPPHLRLCADACARAAEAAGLKATQVPEETWVDGWLLRSAPGRSKRGRSIQPLATGVMALESKLASCRKHYQARALPLLFRITPFAQPSMLDAELARRGYAAFEPCRVMTGGLQAPPEVAGKLPLYSLSQDSFARLDDALAYAPTSEACAGRPNNAGIWLALGSATHPVAVGSVILDGMLAGLYGVRTRADMQGRGYGRQLVAALLNAAHAQGARAVCLQVGADNAPARALYHRFGLRDCYAYWYRCAPDFPIQG